MDDLFLGLNEQQHQATTQTEGPLMVMAGAGSGKTSVLTRRIAHLIFNLGVPREQVLAITFTNKAASEMKQRIAAFLNTSTYTMWISTFHSMCARMLRDHASRLGYKETFQIIDDDDVLSMIKAIMKLVQLDVKLTKPSRLKHFLLATKSGSLDTEQVPEPYRHALALVAPKYQAKMKDNHLMDFEDLMLNTITLLKNFDDVRAMYHQQFTYIHVDEFQDTNTLQYELIRLLVGAHHNLFVVGDEDQSIYAFRGANIENIARLRRDYPDLTTILLEQNYRSTNTILKAANQVIKENPERIEKNLFSTQGEGEPIVFYKGYSDRDEVSYVADTVKQLNRQGIRYEEMAVLYRANTTSRKFEETFIQSHIPYKIIGNLSFFKRKEIKDMVAYLRLILNPHDDFSLMRVVNEPRRGIGAKTMETLSTLADKEGSSMAAIIRQNHPLIPRSAQPKLTKFLDMIDALGAPLMDDSFAVFMTTLLKDTGYEKMLEDDDLKEVRLENIQELVSMFEETRKLLPDQSVDITLTYLLEDIALKSQEDREDDPNSVALMTLHAAKGLEFRVVFLVTLEEGMFPLEQTRESAKELAEERRLMYVGITRAKEKLYFTNAHERMHYGQRMMFPDSQFIRAIDQTLLKLEGMNIQKQKNSERYRRDYQQTAAYKARQARVLTRQENDLHAGDKIKHKAFGEGVVVNIQGEQCTIAFKQGVGLKTLMKDHPAITKV